MTTEDSAPARRTEAEPLPAQALVAPLELLGRAAQAELDPVAILASAQRLAAHHGSSDPYALLVQVAEAHGLHVFEHRGDLASLKGRVSPQTPWMAHGAPGSECSGWVCVSELRGRKVRVTSLSSERDSRWVRTDALPRLLGMEGGAPLRLVSAEDAQPLGFLRGGDALRGAGREPPAGGDHGGGGGGHEHGPSPGARLRALLRLESRDLWVILVYGAAVGVLLLAVPLAVQTLVNAAAFGFLLQPIVVLAVLLVVCLSLAGLMKALQIWAVELLQQRLFVHAAADLAWRLPRARVDALREHHGPELVNRFFEVVSLQKGASLLLVDGLGLALSTLTGLAILAVYHPVLLGFAIILLVLMLGGVLLGLGRGGTKTSIKESKAKYAVVAWLEELARNPTLFRSQSAAAYAHARADALNRQYLGERRRHFAVVFRQHLGALTLQALATAALLGVGGFLVIERQLTLGQLIAGEVIVSAVVASFAKIGKYIETYYDVMAGLDKLGQMVELPLEPEGGAPVMGDEDAARVRLVDVVAPGLPGPFTLDVAPGEHVALVGEHGGGKTAMAGLLYGLSLPTSGRYELGGADVRDLSLRALREAVAWVSEPELLTGTVSENLRLGRSGVGPAEAREALERAQLWDEIAALPRGLETPLQAEGAPLSRGQTIRLVLARALTQRPKVIVVDSLFDGFSGAALEVALRALQGPWTLIVFTQRKSVAQRVGRVIELGARS